jgi:hypothetical protein
VVTKAARKTDWAPDFVRRVEESCLDAMAGAPAGAVQSLQESLWSEMLKHQTSLPDGPCIGKMLQFTVQNDKANYLIMDVRDGYVTVEHLPFNGATSISVQDGKVKLQTIDRMVRLSDQARHDRVTPAAPMPYNKGSLKVQLRFGKLAGVVGSMVKDAFQAADESVLDAVLIEAGSQPSKKCIAFDDSILQSGTAKIIGAKILFQSDRLTCLLTPKKPK